ncbi:hypothetical protein ACWGJT_10725 [Streptomyces xantholiticus]
MHVALSDEALLLIRQGGCADRVLLSSIADVDFRERPDPEEVAATVVLAFGTAYSDHDLMVSLEAAGIPAPDRIVGDPTWVEWRCGRAAGVPACGAARTMDE